MTPALKTSAILAIAVSASTAALTLPQGNAAKSTQPGAASSTSALLQLSSTLGSTYVLQGSHVAYMAVSLTAPEQRHAKRPKVDLSVVLDRSGSMEGEKLSQAKLAARQLIANLDINDRFSIVSYGTDVKLLMPTTLATESAKQAALMTISEIYSDGGTNLSGGLEMGRQQLASLQGRSRRVQRIVLISDGQANEGIVNPEQLANLASSTADNGISITTVGVGLDFDERTMTQISTSGRGNYYFAESAAQLSELFQTELSHLGATVATGISLRVKTSPDVEVREILGYPMVKEGDSWILNVPDMRAGETRKVIVALQVNAQSLKRLSIANLSARFIDASSGETETTSNSLFAVVTADLQQVNQNRDALANRLIERALTAKAIDTATELYEQGRSADAQALIQQRTSKAQSVAADLMDEEFASEMQEAQVMINRNFAEAPAMGSARGKKARKANRNAAYQMRK